MTATLDFVHRIPAVVDGVIRYVPAPPDWLGVQVSNQAEADERIPRLLEREAKVRWLDLRLRGPVNLETIVLRPDGALGNDLSRRLGDYVRPLSGCFSDSPVIYWVVVTGGTDPMHPAWVRSIRDQCRAAGVRFMFVGWGSFGPLDQSAVCLEARNRGHNPGFWTFECEECESSVKRSGFPDPKKCRCRSVYKFGPEMTGRILDGRTWDEMPEGVTL